MKSKKFIAGVMASALALTAVPFAEYSTSAFEIDTNGIIDEITIPDEITATETDYTATIDDIEVYYDFLEDGTIEIKGVKSMPETSVDLTIPAEIDGKAVTSIGESAFQGIKGITSLTISEGIQNISKYAFADCDDIVSISLPSTFTSLGMIGLGSINELKHITVAENNKAFKVIDDVLFSYSGKTIYCYPANKTDLSVYNIPEGVLYIANGCFASNKSLQSVHIPDTVQIIYSSAFRDCKSIKEMRIPESVTDIKYDAFSYIENLKVKILNPDCTFYTDDIKKYPTFDSTAVIYYKVGSTAQAYVEKANLKFKPMFTWGVDNLNFINSKTDFGLSSTATHKDSFTDSEMLNTFKNKISNSEYNEIFKDYTLMNDKVITGTFNENWGGACQGMSAIVVLAKEGIINCSDFKEGATSAYTMGSVKSNEKLRSLIEYYYLLQKTRTMEREIRSKTNQSAITTIKNQIDKDNLTMIGVKNSSGAHTIVGYDYEEGISKTINGVTYDGCIYIYDPNYSTEYNEKSNIYYDTTTFKWTIPNYTFDIINAHVSDLNIINYKGCIDYPEAKDVDENYTHAIFNQNDSSGNITGTSDGKNTSIGTIPAFKDAFENFSSYQQYTFNFDNADFFDIAMEDKDMTLLASSMSSDYVNFDMQNGSITLKNSKPTDYKVSITTNDEPTYEMEMSTYEITGSNAVEVTFTKADNGYYIEADNFSNMSLITYNKQYLTKEPKKITVDKDVKKVYIYQDGNSLKFEPVTEPEYVVGDANCDGEVNIADATAIVQHLGNKDKYGLDEAGERNADVDGSEGITGSDALVLQQVEAHMISLADLPLKK